MRNVAEIPAGVKHWHGAAKDSRFAHLAVEGPGGSDADEWLGPLGGAHYGQLYRKQRGPAKDGAPLFYLYGPAAKKRQDSKQHNPPSVQRGWGATPDSVDLSLNCLPLTFCGFCLGILPSESGYILGP